ncbi:hypothetical protein BDA99DRAFT_499520 [Phascolomyces articulosus]|uniref:Uncharacterized protein n=1 Tax=Phascolomyces articulosus TaxID=60185 RepID=A0AAD5KJN0_9FUNG|nr:hypothetical protein BDA99DRAFT_499520 [Phascolomyces articulosus]
MRFGSILTFSAIVIIAVVQAKSITGNGLTGITGGSDTSLALKRDNTAGGVSSLQFKSALQIVRKNKLKFAKREHEIDENERDENERDENERDEHEHDENERDENERDENERDENERDVNERDEHEH